MCYYELPYVDITNSRSVKQKQHAFQRCSTVSKDPLTKTHTHTCVFKIAKLSMALWIPLRCCFNFCTSLIVLGNMCFCYISTVFNTIYNTWAPPPTTTDNTKNSVSTEFHIVPKMSTNMIQQSKRFV